MTQFALSAMLEAGFIDSHFLPFVSRVEVGCWNWTGFINPKGYGQLSFKRRTVRAHRLAWALAYGPIPDGLCVCHRCDNRRCVRPDHLFIGTNLDNMRDMVAKGRLRNPIADAQRQRTHCPRGHEYTSENTRTFRGKRQCRACHRRWVSLWKARRREQRRLKRGTA